MKASIGNGEIEVARGDLTESAAEAIVNAANNHLWMGAGVAGAIKRKGGIEIEREAISKGPIKVGEAVITGAGRLRSKYVIHAAGMGQDLQTDAHKVREATKNSLKLAESRKVSSIAFPAIGTGVGGFPVEECARTMLVEAEEFLHTSRHVRKIVFVLFGESAFRAFESVLSSLAKGSPR
jgi:O-acetyl-ADP-ribose deacetylase (regulator of RNase III)